MQLICSQCGAALTAANAQPGDRVTCGACGAVLQVPGERIATARPVAASPARPRRTLTWVLAIVGGAVLLAGGVGVGLYLGRDKPEPIAQRTPTPATRPGDESEPKPSPVDNRPTFERVMPSVPVITAMQMVGLGRGSGFLIEHGERLYIVTNRHVVKGAERGFTLSFYKPGSQTVRDAINLAVDSSAVTHVHKTSDLALLDVTDYRNEIRPRKIRPLPLADPDHPPKVMSHVWVFGHPVVGGGLKLDNTVTSGTISRIGDVPGHGLCIGITAPVTHGNSGGPVLDDDGHVIGVVTFGIRGMQRGNFAMHVETLQDLLTDPDARLEDKQVTELLKTSEKAIQAHKAKQKITSELLPELARVAHKLEKQGYHPLPWNQGRNAGFVSIQPNQATRWTIPVADGTRYAVAVFGLRDAKLKTSVTATDPVKLADVAKEENGRVLLQTAKGNGPCQIVVRNEGKEQAPVIMLIMVK